MKFLFPDCIIIRCKHNHIINLVKFSRLVGGGGGGGGGLPLLPSVQCTALLDLEQMFDFKILFAIIFIIISDESRYGFCLVAQPWTYKKIGGPSKLPKDFPWPIPNHSGPD
jgi:hypothetical protein